MKDAFAMVAMVVAKSMAVEAAEATGGRGGELFGVSMASPADGDAAGGECDRSSAEAGNSAPVCKRARARA